MFAPRNLLKSNATTFDRLLRIGRYTRHELVVERQAIYAKPQKRIEVPFDVRGQDSRGCLRRAAAGAAHVDDPDVRAARPKSVSDRAPDDAAAHNRDLHDAIVLTTAEFAAQ